MRLIEYGTVNDSSLWNKNGYELPRYNRVELREKTMTTPTWIHFGAGNIFRAFPAAVLNQLLNQGDYDKGVIVCEGFDTEIIDKAYRPYDELSLLVVLKADGTISKKVVGSVVESLKADITETDDWERLKTIFRAPSLQMASFTITEKGYSITLPDGSFAPVVLEDFVKNGLEPKNIMGKITALLYERYCAGAAPIAMVSMDNCSHNGDKLSQAVLKYAENWVKYGFIPKSFLDYVNDKTKVTFPWSMIDKITPRPDSAVEQMLKADGFLDTELIITAKNTYTAPFVNAEETEYLVIEDAFPNGRPPLEKGGILFTERETVDKVEKMKVCTCLNPLHTALAIYGCLLSYVKISDEMNDPALVDLISKMGYIEAMPVVVDPGIIAPRDFIKAVLEQRLPNPFMPDAPQRIATDTSQKLSIRFGETLKAYVEQGLDLDQLTMIPLVLAGYGRYLMGINDDGEEFKPSDDPRLIELMDLMKEVKLGQKEIPKEALKQLYSQKNIFAVDLYEIGLGEKIEGMFMELIEGPGSIRTTLQKYTK